MVTQIQLGNIYQQNGKTVVGGGQSAIDTEGLINALAEAKRIPAVKLEDKIKINDSRAEALGSLKDILSRFKDASSLLRNPPGVNNETSNIFAYRTTNLSTNTGVSASNYLSVTAQPGSNIQSFSVDEIQQLARETKQDTGTFSLTSADASVVGTVATPGQFTAGAFSLRNATGGADVSITLADGDSLQTVANKFNAVKDQTGIQATVLKVANGVPNSTYTIVYTATKTGETYGFDLNDPGTVTSGSAVFDEITFNVPTQMAQNAVFTIDGVEVERESNVVSDLIDGMTFTLNQGTPALTTVAVSVVADTEVAKTAITNFADIYNEFRVFFAEQTEIGSDGTSVETAVLMNNSTLRSISTAVSTEITAVIAGLSNGDPTRLSDIGIDFADFPGDSETPLTRNIIQINSEKLDSALAADFEGVRGIFAFQMSSDSPDVTIFSRTNALAATSIQIDVNITAGTYNATYVDKQGLTQSASFTAEPIPGTTSITLTGEEGTGLEGLVFIYASADDAIVNMTVSQGIGDRLFNSLETSLAPEGTVETELSNLATSNTRYTEEITRIDDQITKYREQLQQQYASLEAALSSANQILQVLDAQASARESS